MGMLIKNKVQYINQPASDILLEQNGEGIINVPESTENIDSLILQGHVYTKEEFNNIITDSVENSNIATLKHSKDSYFIYNDILYIATANISVGGKIIPNTNCKKVSVIEELQKSQEVDPSDGGEIGHLIDKTITSISSPVSIIGDYAFYECPLETISFPLCKSIGYWTFRNCLFSTIDFPMCEYIDDGAFDYCTALTSANFPLCEYIGNYTFSHCTILNTINFPVCDQIGVYAFADCQKLATINFPSCRIINTSAFISCSGLTTISFPACTEIGPSAFVDCSNLTAITFPMCKSIFTCAFLRCTKITLASFPECQNIYTNAFSGCRQLISLYLTGSSYAALMNSTAFLNTPIGGYSSSAGQYGSIYVPSSMLASYKTKTNWTYFSSRFVGI